MSLSGESWKQLFESWPKAVAKSGVLVTTFNENITFVNFLVSPGVLLLERDRPDTIGARKVMLSWEAIAAIKLPDVAELSRYQVMGFQPPM